MGMAVAFILGLYLGALVQALVNDLVDLFTVDMLNAILFK